MKTDLEEISTTPFLSKYETKYGPCIAIKTFFAKGALGVEAWFEVNNYKNGEPMGEPGVVCHCLSIEEAAQLYS